MPTATNDMAMMKPTRSAMKSSIAKAYQMWYGSRMHSDERITAMTVLAIRDTNVYYAGEIVGSVIESKFEDGGLRVLLRIHDPNIRRTISKLPPQSVSASVGLTPQDDTP